MEWLGIVVEPTALTGIGLLAIVVLVLRAPVAASLRAGAVGLTLFFFWFATPLGANIMVAALEETAREIDECTTRGSRPVVVILAGGMSGQPGEAGEFARLQEASYRRTLAGLELARTLPRSSVIVSGGSGANIREADLMRALMVALGFPADRVAVERDSGTTHESAAAVARLLGKERNHSVILVTSALHMARARATFAVHGVPVCRYPVDSRWIQPRPQDALVPQISALSKSSAVVHEALGLLWYSMNGRVATP